MDERLRELRVLDELEPSDLWNTIHRREHGPAPRRTSAGRRVTTALVAGVIAIGAVSLIVFAFRPDRGEPVFGPASNGPLVLVRIAETDSFSPYGGPHSVWTILPDGSGLHEIQQAVPHEDTLQAFTPRWSPDGSRVLWYAGDGHRSAGSIWTEVPGRGLTAIVSCESIGCGIWDPEWSPDGEAIAFARGMSIFAIDPDGSGQRELIQCPDCTGLESGPTWSPDGSRIAFSASDADYHGAIFMMDADGSNLERIFDCGSDLCQGGLRGGSVDWSPTMDQLVFTLERNVWTIRPDGSDRQRLTSCPVSPHPSGCEPSTVTWSPDGTEIAYSHGKGGLVIMNADGSDPREIGPGELDHYLDSWQPVSLPRADPSPPARETCVFPPYRPTYLPWLTAGQSLPDPAFDRIPADAFGNPSYATLLWKFGNVRDEGGPELKGTVVLWRTTEPVSIHPVEPAVPGLPGGSPEGSLATSPGKEDWAVIWLDASPDEYADPCGYTTLVVSLPNQPSARVRTEALEVARSLVREED